MQRVVFGEALSGVVQSVQMLHTQEAYQKLVVCNHWVMLCDDAVNCFNIYKQPVIKQCNEMKSSHTL